MVTFMNIMWKGKQTQKVVVKKYEVNPWVQLIDLDLDTPTEEDYKITSVGANQGLFYFVLTKDAQGFSEKQQSIFVAGSWNALEETIEKESRVGMTNTEMIVTSICFCEKTKRYLVVMTESDAMQDRRWDTGNKKDDNWRKDKERGGYHPTIVFKDPTDDMIWRVVTKDNDRVSINVIITDVACNT